MKKHILGLILAFFILGFLSVTAHTKSTESLNVDLGDVQFVSSEYTNDENLVVPVSNTDSEIVVNITDKDTGKVLETMSCEKADDPYDELDNDDLSYYIIRDKRTDEFSTITLEIGVILYKHGSFSCIYDVVNTDMFVTEPSSPEINQVSCYVHSVEGTFPSTHIEYIGTGVFRTDVPNELSLEDAYGMDSTELEKLGYTVYGVDGNGQSVQKTITIQGDFYTYSK